MPSLHKSVLMHMHTLAGHHSLTYYSHYQVAAVGKVYPGGVSAYVTKARELLQASKRGDNPLAGYKPTVSWVLLNSCS